MDEEELEEDYFPCDWQELLGEADAPHLGQGVALMGHTLSRDGTVTNLEWTMVGAVADKAYGKDEKITINNSGGRLPALPSEIDSNGILNALGADEAPARCN